MNLGAEPKKLALLGGLVAAVAVVNFVNFSPDTPPTSNTPARSGPNPVSSSSGAPALPGPPSPSARSSAGGRNGRDFRFTFKGRRPEDRVNPLTVDPTLRLDLLDKVRDVKRAGGERSLFDIAAAKPAEPAVKLPNPGVKINVSQVPYGPERAPVPPPPQPPPPPPPIPLKFFGYINAKNQGPRRAFFLDGEDIHVVSEGEVVKRRYRIVRIGVNSVVVEDTQFKNQQTLPLEQQVG